MKDILIVHEYDKWGQYTYIQDGPQLLGIVEYQYVCGWTRPRYPVPAPISLIIQTDVWIDNAIIIGKMKAKIEANKRKAKW